eukprot:403342301
MQNQNTAVQQQERKTGIILQNVDDNSQQQIIESGVQVSQNGETPKHTTVKYQPVISSRKSNQALAIDQTNGNETQKSKMTQNLESIQSQANMTQPTRKSLAINQVLSPKNERNSKLLQENSQKQLSSTLTIKTSTNSQQQQLVSPKSQTQKFVTPKSKSGAANKSKQNINESSSQNKSTLPSNLKKNIKEQVEIISTSVASQLQQNTSNELINIRLPGASKKNKQTKLSARGKQNVDDRSESRNTQNAGNIEIWQQNQNERDILNQTNTTYIGSDIADEFEYNYDPGYLSQTSRSRERPDNEYKQSKNQKFQTKSNQNRFMSPQQPSKTGRKAPTLLLEERSPKQLQNQKHHLSVKGKKSSTKLASGEIGTESIRQSPRASQAQVIQNSYGSPSHKTKRQQQYINDLKAMSPSSGVEGQKLKTGSGFKSSKKTFDRLYQSGRKNERNSDMSPTGQKKQQDSQQLADSEQKRKLRGEECENLYYRMKEYNQRKQEAIKMMQEAKRKEEDDEYLQSIAYRKVNRDQKEKCYQRLAQDAEKRKVDKVKQTQAQILQQEQEMKELFKPKINENFKSYRRDIFNAASSGNFRSDSNNFMHTQSIESSGPLISALGVQHGMTLEQKIANFQNEAHIYKNQKRQPNEFNSHLENTQFDSQ